MDWSSNQTSEHSVMHIDPNFEPKSKEEKRKYQETNCGSSNAPGIYGHVGRIFQVSLADVCGSFVEFCRQMGLGFYGICPVVKAHYAN